MKETLQFLLCLLLSFHDHVHCNKHIDGFGAVVNGRSYLSNQQLGLTKLILLC